MAFEAPNTPPPVPPPELPNSAQEELARQQLENSPLGQLDIRDPTEVRANIVEPDESPAPAPPLIPGASSQQFPDDLMRRAWEAGLSADDAKAYGTPQLLERTLSYLERAQPEPAPRQQQAPPAPVPVPAVEEFSPLTSTDPEIQFHADLVTHLDKLHKFHDDRYKTLQKQMEQVLQNVQQTQTQAQARQEQESHAKLESLFAADEDYREVFGAGSKHQYAETSAEFQARRQVAESMDILHQGYVATGRRPPTLEALYEQAKKMVHGQGQPKQVQATFQNHQGQFIGKPTNTKSKQDVPGDELAFKNLKLRMRAMGMTS